MVRGWLVGHRLQGCTRAGSGTYTCTIAGKGRVYWNPTRTVTVRVARNVSSRTSLYGVKARLRGGSALKVDYRPVLVRSTRVADRAPVQPPEPVGEIRELIVFRIVRA